MIMHLGTHARSHARTLSLAPALAAAAGSRLVTGDNSVAYQINHRFVSIYSLD